jgi:hypothetical protein
VAANSYNTFTNFVHPHKENSMPRSITKLAALVASAGAILALPAGATAAELPLAGKWKLVDVGRGNDVSLILFEIEEKDGKVTAKTVSSPILGDDLALRDLRVDATSVRFSFPFRGETIKVAAFAAKGDDKPKTLRGSIQLGPQALFAELQRSDLKEIDRKDAVRMTPAAEMLAKAGQGDDPKVKEQLLNEILEKHGDTAAGYAAAEMLLQLRVTNGAKEDDLKAAAERMVKTASLYGPTMEKTALRSAAQALVRAEKVSPLAVDLARKAVAALAPDDPPAQTSEALKTLEAALRKTGKADEAKDVLARIDKIEGELDAEFEKTSVPFEPEKYKGRKGKSTRVAVVELFTGAHCPPCVAADVAFDAAIKAYPPADVVLLEYHLHIPRPDPLTNADAEGRQKFYGDVIEGTPTMFVIGKVTEGIGGPKAAGKDGFGTLKGLIDQALEAEDQAALKLDVERKGDRVEATATVSGLKKTGEKVRLRFVLVEDVVRYAGRNGQRLHHHVVRALPGGVDGFPLTEATGKQAVAVVLGDLKNTLSDYLKKSNEKRAFLDDERPLNLKHLKVIALIQDDATKEILQAVQVEVPEGK